MPSTQTPSIRTIYEYAILAQATYIDLTDINPFSVNDLIAAADDQGKLPETLGTRFFQPNPNFVTWEVAAEPQNNDSSGFAATLFESSDGQTVLAIRGTEADGINIRTWNDLAVADIAHIGGVGLAVEQCVAMFNYIQCLRAGDGVTNVLQLELRSAPLAPPGTPSVAANGRQYWLVANNNGVGLDAIAPGQQITVTGHSLGGDLADLATRLFPGLFTESFTFNAAGTDPLSSAEMTDEFLALFVQFDYGDTPAGSFDASRIHTYQSESSVPGDDWEFVSADWTGVSASPEVELPVEFNSHAVGQIMDATGLQSVPATLDSSVRLEDIARLYASASENVDRTPGGSSRTPLSPLRRGLQHACSRGA